jgi:hypothetical protein
MLGTAIRPREQRILSVERDGTDGGYGKVATLSRGCSRPASGKSEGRATVRTMRTRIRDRGLRSRYVL